jgi:hypothetical protein
MEREGLPRGAIGKLLVVHKQARTTGWEVLTRLAGTQIWTQLVVATLQTPAGLYIIDPTLCDDAEPEGQWLERFPPERLNPTEAPTPSYLQWLFRCSDIAFQKMLALAKKNPAFYKHLLSHPAVAAWLERLGSPVRYWLERSGPVGEKFDPHVNGLAAAAIQVGPLVRGEVVRVRYGADFFTDAFWDTAGPFGARGLTAAREYLDQLRDTGGP